VNGYVITPKTIDDWVTGLGLVGSGSERLIPPAFHACIDRLREEWAESGTPGRSTAQLQAECTARYRAVQQAALEHLISELQLVLEARELGLSRALRGGIDLTAVRPKAFGALAHRASLAIRRAAESRARPVGGAEVASYYLRHRDELFALVPPRRDVAIARTMTIAVAKRVRRELQAGASFARVVEEPDVGEADFGSEGLVLALRPNTYGEPQLNKAIFAATRGTLVGPVGTSFGYFVFRVTGLRPGRYRPLRAVSPMIRRRLKREARKQAIAAFTTMWQSRWTSRTECAPSYVVRGCRQLGR
jgi:hypothetical protein